MSNWADGHDNGDEEYDEFISSSQCANSIDDTKELLGYMNPNTFDDFSNDLHTIADKLTQRTDYFGQKFESQRRGIGQGFGTQNDIVLASKQGIAAVKRRDTVQILHKLDEFLYAWNDLGSLPMPRYKSWQFDAESGQEVVEFIAVAFFYPRLLGLPLEKWSLTIDDLWHSPECDIYNCRQMHFEEAIWLHGMGDALSELGKILTDILINDDNSEGESLLQNTMQLRKRFLEIAKVLYELLDRFETSYEMVMKATLRPGYGNTYRGLLQRLRNIIYSEKKELLQDKLRIANQAMIRETIAEEIQKQLRIFFEKNIPLIEG